MTDPTEPRVRSTLERVSDPGYGVNDWLDPRTWRRNFGERALPAYLLVLLFIGVFIAEWFSGGPVAWGLSTEALSAGRWHTLLAHMAAHGGIAHLWMNSSALLALTSPLMMQLGPVARAWPRYLLLFLGAGLAGAAVYLAINWDGGLPMVGASGAIFGLWGALTRLGPDGEITPLRSRRVWLNVRQFVVINVVLFALLFFMSAGQGGLAWESHLGGFVFGLLVGPMLADRSQ